MKSKTTTGSVNPLLEDDSLWDYIYYYRRWAKFIQELEPESRLYLHDAIDKFILTRELPNSNEDKALCATFNVLIKEAILSNKKEYKEKIERNRENGKLGGRPSKPKQTEWLEKKPKGFTEKPKKPNKDKGIDKGIVKDKDFLSLSLEERKNKFWDELMTFKDDFSIDTLNSFYCYWAEPQQGVDNPLMRRELEQTWDTKSRLNGYKLTLLRKEKRNQK